MVTTMPTARATAPPAPGSFAGKAPEAALYSIRVFDETLSTGGRLLIAAVEWAIAQGMDLVNLSLGTTDVRFVTRSSRYVAKQQKEVLFWCLPSTTKGGIAILLYCPK